MREGNNEGHGVKGGGRPRMATLFCVSLPHLSMPSTGSSVEWEFNQTRTVVAVLECLSKI